MLLGLALFEWGFLSGEWSKGDYAKVTAIGYALGLPLAALSFYHSYLYSPNLEISLRRMELVPIEWVRLIYPFQRIFLVMAHVAAIILLYKAKYAQAFFDRRSRRANGAYQLHHAVRHLHAFLLRLWIELLRPIGVLPDLLRRLCRLDPTIDRQSNLAAVFPLRPARMGVAEPDLLEKAACTVRPNQPWSASSPGSRTASDAVPGEGISEGEGSSKQPTLLAFQGGVEIQRSQTDSTEP